MKKWLISSGLAMVAMTWMVTPVLAQPADGDPRGARSERGQRGEPGERGQRGQRREGGEQAGRAGMARERMEQMRQRRAERLQRVLGVADGEWQVLEPMIERVQELNLQGRGGLTGQAITARMRGQATETEEVELPAAVQEGQALRTLLRNEDATPEQIAGQLEALRTARQQHAMELEAAREQLRELLSPRQEAQLVLMGLLE